MNVLGQHRLRHIALAAVALSLIAGLTPTVTADGDDTRRRLPLDIDVAVNGVTFRPILAGELTADGFPPRGSTFIIDGYVYPAGTFASHGLDKGILPDGRPEFRELVIGTWTCRGWFSVDPVATTTGAYVATTQFFDFKLALGREAFFTEGFEPFDANNPLRRLILGGTARFEHARGQHIQTTVAFNATDSPNYTFRHR